MDSNDVSNSNSLPSSSSGLNCACGGFVWCVCVCVCVCVCSCLCVCVGSSVWLLGVLFRIYLTIVSCNYTLNDQTSSIDQLILGSLDALL